MMNIHKIVESFNPHYIQNEILMFVFIAFIFGDRKVRKIINLYLHPSHVWGKSIPRSWRVDTAVTPCDTIRHTKRKGRVNEQDTHQARKIHG